jgi:hypothetical protein
MASSYSIKCTTAQTTMAARAGLGMYSMYGVKNSSADTTIKPVGEFTVQLLSKIKEFLFFWLRSRRSYIFIIL